jgi:hypothetical protein
MAHGTIAGIASTAANVVLIGQWAHVAVTVDRLAGEARIYLDGVDATIAGSIRTDFATSSDFEIARMEGSLAWLGALDEVNVASTVLPADWIATMFANQSSPASFIVLGPEETR